MKRSEPSSYWWSREDLCYNEGRLEFAGRSVTDLSARFEYPSRVPVFLYSFCRVRSNLRRVHSALNHADPEMKFKIYYAMKANRFTPLLTAMKQTGLCGIDACSPEEVERALSCGFLPEEISYTGTSLSPDDLRRLLAIPGLRLNIDSIATLHHVGRLSPGREIGLRVNPGLGIGRTGNEKLHYSGEQTTKFGIYRDRFEEALEVAAQYDLEIKRIHFHTGCGYLNEELSQLEEILDLGFWFTERAKSVDTLNIGGGLGVAHTAQDRPLDLDRWAKTVTSKLAKRNLKLEIEPGDYIVKDAGILLLNVNYTELKKDTFFLFVNGGFNIAVEPAVYGLPFEPVPALLREGPLQKTTVAGNINEALDIWYKGIDLSPVEENDTLVLLNAGAYSSSMASHHCLRGEFKEFILF